MKNFSVQVAKIVGTPNQKSWSQVYTFFPEDEEKKRKRGVLLAGLSFLTQEEIGTIEAGREIITRLQEEYYGETETAVMEKLTEAVRKIAQEFTNQEEKLEICAVCLIKNTLYLAIFGNGQIWLKRQGLLGKVLEGDPPVGGQVSNASGLVEEGDLLLLGTSSFFSLLGQGVLRAALENNDPQEAVETLAPLVHGQESASQAAALIGKIMVEEEAVVDLNEEIEVAPEIDKVEEKQLKRPNLGFGRQVSQFFHSTVRFRRASPEIHSQKTIFTIAVILIILLSLSIFLGAKKREENEKERRFNQIYEEVSLLLEQGRGLVEINPQQGRELLFQAKEKFSELERLKIESIKAAELKNQIDSTLDSVVKEYKLDEAPVLTDLSLIKAGGRGDSFSLSGKYLAILDKNENLVLGFEISRKSGEILAGGDSLNQTKLLVWGDDLVFILEEKGIAQIKNKKTEREKIKTDQEWGEIVLMKVYGSNLYLLDKGKNTIWRYQAGEESFGPRQKWFNQAVAPDLSLVISMAVDGSIWLLTSEGKILKFTQGSAVAFGLAGLDKPFSSPTVIYTDQETQNLYVLDRGNARVVVLAKSGEYQAQYLWSGISQVTDMVVSEVEKKILLLSGSKIYEIGLK